MSQSKTRATLLSRVRDPQDEASWREFDDRYRDLIQRYCRRRGLQPANAEDVRQLVMLSMLKTLPTFTYRPELGRFRDYLGRVVRNAIASYLSCPKPAAKQVLLEDLERLPDDGAPSRDEIWEKEWTQHHFRRAMAKADRCFDARSLDMFRHLLSGQSTASVAASFDVTPAAVYKAKHRVRDFLEEAISEQVRDEQFGQ